MRCRWQCLYRRTVALQAGCWDGTVAIWRLQPDENTSAVGGSVPATPVLLSHARADPSPLRAVAWAPAALAASAADSLGRAVHMTAGNQGALSIWDARCGWDEANRKQQVLCCG
jgi:hypothetical protein